MSNLPEFLPCPFCGETPSISEVEDRDDRRYMAMELECCVTMSAEIGYGRYRSMTAAAINDYLVSRLADQWNVRVINN